MNDIPMETNPVIDMIYQCDKLEYFEMDMHIAHYAINNFTIAEEDDIVLALHIIEFKDDMTVDEEWDAIFTALESESPFGFSQGDE